jgi:hypothetical protein
VAVDFYRLFILIDELDALISKSGNTVPTATQWLHRTKTGARKKPRYLLDSGVF